MNVRYWGINYGERKLYKYGRAAEPPYSRTIFTPPRSTGSHPHSSPRTRTFPLDGGTHVGLLSTPCSKTKLLAPSAPQQAGRDILIKVVSGIKLAIRVLPEATIADTCMRWTVRDDALMGSTDVVSCKCENFGFKPAIRSPQRRHVVLPPQERAGCAPEDPTRYASTTLRHLARRECWMAASPTS